MQNPLQVKRRGNRSSKLLVLGIVVFGVASSMFVLFSPDSSKTRSKNNGLPLSALSTPPVPTPVIIPQPASEEETVFENMKKEPLSKETLSSMQAEARIVKRAAPPLSNDSRQGTLQNEKRVTPGNELKKPTPSQQPTRTARPHADPESKTIRARESTAPPSRKVERAMPSEPQVREVTSLRAAPVAEQSAVPANNADWRPIPIKKAPASAPNPLSPSALNTDSATTSPSADTEAHPVPEIQHVEARPLVPEPFSPHVVEAVGERVWLRIDPRRTIIVRPGQAVEGLGAFSGISGKSAVFENGTLPLNK